MFASQKGLEGCKRRKVKKVSPVARMVNNIAKPCASNLVIVKTAAENGQQIKVLIDSAAQTEVLCQSTAERLGLKVEPSVAQINSA